MGAPPPLDKAFAVLAALFVATPGKIPGAAPRRAGAFSYGTLSPPDVRFLRLRL